MNKKISIAIDGPAAAGKSTTAKIVAGHLRYLYIDTGAMYRALTYKALMSSVDLNDETAMSELLDQTEITLVNGENGQLVYLDDTDVTMEVRSNEVTNNVSVTAMHKAVREEMVVRQRKLAENGGVVMDGRDIGTHVLPNADVKIFLVASVKERAERRHQENITKGFPSDIRKLEEEIARRDKLDSEREVSPLIKANDAIEIDTTSMTIQDVVDKILEIAKGRKA